MTVAWLVRSARSRRLSRSGSNGRGGYLMRSDLEPRLENRANGGDMTKWERQALEAYAKRNAPLPREEVARVVIQIGDALQVGHAAGIVHRDPKPDNVLYDSESGHVRLLDFGVPGDINAPPDERLRPAGFFVGTLMYV